MITQRRAFGRGKSLGYIVLLALFSVMAGCESQHVSEGQELNEFLTAGALIPEVDISELLLAAPPQDRYQPIAGDLLEIYMPQVLATMPAVLPVPESSAGSHTARIQQNGAIAMPLVGMVEVAGRTLPEIEVLLAGRYYPEFIKTEPAIIVRVKEYNTGPVTIVGGVGNPGVYHLRHDEMSLVSLIQKAGGVTDDARAVWIKPPDAELPEEPVMLPIKGLETAFSDVRLEPGTAIYVEAVPREVIAVIGLVRTPTAINPPPGVTYNLLQGLAQAGGLDPIADPHYVTVYRKTVDDRIVSARFKVVGPEVMEGGRVHLKEGDVVAVERTGRTDFRLLLKEVIRVGVGISYNPLR